MKSELNEGRSRGAFPVGKLDLAFFDCSMSNLAAVVADPYSQEEVDCECRHCGTPLRTIRINTPFIACDACIAKAATDEKTQRHSSYWRSLFGDEPTTFDETDKAHPDFPIRQYNLTMNYLGDRSLLFFGSSGTGKTRLAVMLLKRCLWRRDMFVSILWPEVLKSVKYSHERLNMLYKWAKYDLLLIDDGLLAGASDEKITDWFKELLDLRIRYKKPVIITSQVGEEEYIEDSDKYRNATNADRKRVDALLRRIREQCEVIQFTAPVKTGNKF